MMRLLLLFLLDRSAIVLRVSGDGNRRRLIDA